MPVRPSPCLHPLFLVLLLCLISREVRADTPDLSAATGQLQKISLKPYLSLWEDTTGRATSEAALRHFRFFAPLDSLQPGSPTSVYWLKMPFPPAGAHNSELVVRFSHLTFVDGYLYRGDSCMWHGRAGAFRPRSLIRKGDSRFHLVMPLQPGETYTLLLRVHHSKGYKPFFDFALQSKESFLQEVQNSERVDSWAQGAIAIFFLYTGLSWLVSRYRPYLWLLLFIGGTGLYGLCSGRYFIDWFFAEQPARGWLFNGPFLHLGLLGLYLLVVDFWQLPQYNPTVYRFGKICITILVAVSLGGLCINYFTGNFNLSNSINLWAFVFPFSFVLVLLLCCYKRLDRAQKYLYYGLVLFVAAGLYITLSSAFFKEQALLAAPYVAHFTALSVFLIFSTGLKEALRQHEIDKWAALQQLTQLQQQQTILLEKKVDERTQALQNSHERLQAQTGLLAQRNATIETLMNELGHRVKNNLQLLYSLNSLQLPSVPDGRSRQILKGNLSRIKAMMLVNQKLDYTGETIRVNVASLVTELFRHLQEIHDRPKMVSFLQEISKDIELPSRQALSMGLILTELITNSFKYAFDGSPEPTISIRVSSLATHCIELVYADNGPGMDPDKISPSSSMGLSLILDLTRQLNGTLTTIQKHGLIYKLTMPVLWPTDTGKD